MTSDFYCTRKLFFYLLAILLATNFVLAKEEVTDCYPSYYQIQQDGKDGSDYYPLLSKNITSYTSNQLTFVEQIKTSTNKLQLNEKIVVCSYMRNKQSANNYIKIRNKRNGFQWKFSSSKLTFKEEAIITSREKFPFFIIFLVIGDKNATRKAII